MKTHALFQLMCLIAAINGQSSEIYTCTRDVNIATSLQMSALIASFKTIDRLLCLGECSRNLNCLSCSYNDDATTTIENCDLYNKVFNSSEYSYANNVDWYSKTGSTLSSATTAAATTISSDCNSSLMCYFKSTTLNSSITSYNSIAFGLLESTEMAIVNNTPVYFLADFSNNALVKMSDSWQFITKVNTITGPRVIKSANDHLYVSAKDGFHKIDYNLNIINSIVDTSAYYNAIQYNTSDNTLVVALWNRNRVDWINAANLTVLAYITLTYQPVGVAGYGDSLYVSATSGSVSTVIYVIRNRVIINTISISSTTGMNIFSIIFDDYGYMALTFETQKAIQLYHINGTSTGFKLTFPSSVFHINFDFDRRMMISTQNALLFYK